MSGLSTIKETKEKTWLEEIQRQAPKLIEELKVLIVEAEDSLTNKSGKAVNTGSGAIWQAWTYNLSRIETNVIKLRNLPFTENN